MINSIFSVLYIPPGNSRSYQQWMQVFKSVLDIIPKCFYPWLFFLMFRSFYSWVIFNWKCDWQDSVFEVVALPLEWRGCLNVQIQRECSLVWSGACSRTVETDREGDRSDLTWQDVLRHDMLIWQQTQALLRWTDPRT